MILYIMGVSGSGKTLIGKLLAQRMNLAFHDGDDFHSAANKAKMAAGDPLDDTDREPWLETLNALARHIAQRGEGAVIACSALKHQYRATLSRGLARDEVRFVFLDGSRDLIADRLQHRHHEYMNPSLLQSQLETLEVPADALRVVNDRTPEEVVDTILSELAPILLAK